MKHEIDDEMVNRAHDVFARVGIVYGDQHHVVREALEAALRPPQRRWADSQREERRCGEKHIEGNQVVAGVEAPHGAEESAAPGATWADSVAVGFPVGREDGLVSLHLGGSYTYLTAPEIKTLVEKLNAPLDATRRPPNPTSDIHVSVSNEQILAGLLEMHSHEWETDCDSQDTRDSLAEIYNAMRKLETP